MPNTPVDLSLHTLPKRQAWPKEAVATPNHDLEAKGESGDAFFRAEGAGEQTRPQARAHAYPPRSLDHRLSQASKSDRVEAWWDRRSGVQKGLMLAAAAVGTALAVGLPVGFVKHRAHEQAQAAQALSNSPSPGFSGNFSRDGLADWKLSHDVANGGSFRCGFTKKAVSAVGDLLQLRITGDSVAGEKRGCGQLIHDQVFGYGNYSGMIQPMAAPGVVTGMFLYADTGNRTNQEIDIEFVGRNTSIMWATTFRDGNVTTKLVDLGFDASRAAHNYSFEWAPDAIRWRVDGQQVHELTDPLPRAVPQHLYLSTWLREPSDWAGQYDPSAPPPAGQSSFSEVSFQKA